MINEDEGRTSADAANLGLDLTDSHRPEDLVRQFHEVYGLPIQHGQASINHERVHMRQRLIFEEV